MPYLGPIIVKQAKMALSVKLRSCKDKIAQQAQVYPLFHQRHSAFHSSIIKEGY
jgi:hypothetical protein